MGVLKAKIGGVWTPISQGWSPIAGGLVGYAYGPTSDTVHTSGQPITGMSVTWNAVAGRTYRVTVTASMLAGTATAVMDLGICDASNTTIIIKPSQEHTAN